MRWPHFQAIERTTIYHTEIKTSMPRIGKPKQLEIIDLKQESKNIDTVKECISRNCSREFRLNRAKAIRQDSITGFYTIYDLSAKYNMCVDNVKRILMGSRCKLAALQDGLGSISITNNNVKTLSSVVKVLRVIGFSFVKIGRYLKCSRQYAGDLYNKPDSRRRPLVPIILSTKIKSKQNKNIGPGTYFVQYADSGEWILLYERADAMPYFVSVSALKEVATIATGMGIILPKIS